jgi:hypothetical protein
VKYGISDGLGCDANAYMNHHFTEEEFAGEPQPDQHWHEHATCFRLGDRALVVISSCGHAGIVNASRRAQEVSGVEKIYALVGGFHLAPAPDDYLRQVMAELKKFDLGHVLPMHCSGQNFIALPKQEMPEKLVLCTTVSRFIHDIRQNSPLAAAAGCVAQARLGIGAGRRLRVGCRRTRFTESQCDGLHEFSALERLHVCGA